MLLSSSPARREGRRRAAHQENRQPAHAGHDRPDPQRVEGVLSVSRRTMFFAVLHDTQGVIARTAAGRSRDAARRKKTRRDDPRTQRKSSCAPRDASCTRRGTSRPRRDGSNARRSTLIGQRGTRNSNATLCAAASALRNRDATGCDGREATATRHSVRGARREALRAHNAAPRTATKRTARCFRRNLTVRNCAVRHPYRLLARSA